MLVDGHGVRAVSLDRWLAIPRSPGLGESLGWLVWLLLARLSEQRPAAASQGDAGWPHRARSATRNRAASRRCCTPSAKVWLDRRRSAAGWRAERPCPAFGPSAGRGVADRRGRLCPASGGVQAVEQFAVAGAGVESGRS